MSDSVQRGRNKVEGRVVGGLVLVPRGWVSAFAAACCAGSECLCVWVGAWVREGGDGAPVGLVGREGICSCSAHAVTLSVHPSQLLYLRPVTSEMPILVARKKLTHMCLQVNTAPCTPLPACRAASMRQISGVNSGWCLHIGT